MLRVHLDKVVEPILVDRVIERECSLRFVWTESPSVKEYKLTVRG